MERSKKSGMIHRPLPRRNDPEGERVPESLPCIVDVHVHLFPDKLFTAIRNWLDEFAWRVRYRLRSPEVIEFLLARGVDRVVGLHYAHKPGMARTLNTYMAGLCRDYPQVIGTATVFPGEEGAGAILGEAFERGLIGVKLHAHVQFFDLDSDEMNEIYDVCLRRGQPLVMHVGREPKSSVYHYQRDPYRICGADKLEPVLKQYPGLR
ncbi:MAG: amidohydrolase family protein, partial [Deltaproteobacteria bacterium]